MGGCTHLQEKDKKNKEEKGTDENSRDIVGQLFSFLDVSGDASTSQMISEKEEEKEEIKEEEEEKEEIKEKEEEKEREEEEIKEEITPDDIIEFSKKR